VSLVIEHLENLIRIPSVSSVTNRPVIEYAEQSLHAAGWQTRRQTYADNSHVEKINLIAAPNDQPVNDGAVDIAFVCHTDTVPFASSWKNALSPYQDNGFLHGCGACDVKGFLACVLAAAHAVRSARVAKLRIVLTADEEVGCVGAKHLLTENLLRPAKVVIGEPTSLHPARAGKGYCLAQVTVTGQEAHSAHPDRGASAITGAAHLLIALDELADQLKREQNDFFTPGYTTLNVGTIQGGTAKNIIPGQCTFLVEWRPIPGPSADRIPAVIEEAIDKLQRANPRIRYEFKIARQQQGFETAADSALVRSLETLSGKPASSIPFGSEASLFATLCDEVVVFGPGDMQMAHSSRECVEIAQLHRAVECLRTLMLVHTNTLNTVG
jgi:acetylornithine deacetylase